MTQPLIVCLYGEPGTGKSPASATTTAPRLIIDTENGHRFVRGRKVTWNPQTHAPPPVDDSWDTCIVQCRDWATFEATMAVLHSGDHPFVSVTVDSLSELQKRCRDLIFESGRAQGAGEVDEMNERRWGVLLQKMEKAVRELRDLTMHPVRPLGCVVIVCLSDELNGKKVPLIQGGLRKTVPGFVDVMAFVSADLMGNVSMSVQPRSAHTAKDRTGTLPADIGAPFDIDGMRQHIHNTLEGNQQ